MNIQKAFTTLLLSIYVLSLSAQVLPLGQPISSALTDEFNPSISGNGKILLFEQTYLNSTKPDIMMSIQSNGAWGRPDIMTAANTNIETIINAGYFINHAGDEIVFHSSRYGGVGGTDIWYLQKNANGSWSVPKNLAKPVNSELNEIDPSISPDGKYLYFTVLSDKKTPAGQACGKIMVAERNGNNGWKPPVALPAPINTGCESGGKLLSDGKTFLFSSMRTGGKGGYDVYISKLKEDGTYSTPLPYTFLNTDKDDKYVSVAAGGSMAYYAALSKTGKERDIMRAKIPDELQPETVRLYQGKVLNSATNTSLSAQITVTNTRTGKQTIYSTTADGSFSVPVPRTDNYDIGVFSVSPGFNYTSEFSEVSTDKKYEEKNINFTLTPLVSGMLIPMKNLSFENNGITTDKKGDLEISRVKFFMRLNPTTSIIIRAYTDKVITDTIRHSDLDKDITSEQDTTIHTPLFSDDHTLPQATYIYNTVLKGGIPATRMTYLGMGLDEHQSEEDRRKRYELVIK